MKTQTESSIELTARCVGMTIEAYKAKYCGPTGRKQNRLACLAVRQALAGRGEDAQRILKQRKELLK
jgi:hypothetical protein